MSLYIRNAETDRLARTLADRTGLSLTEAITSALRHELDRTPEPPRKRSVEEMMAAVRAIQARVAELPVLEEGSDDELLFDADGLPR